MPPNIIQALSTNKQSHHVFHDWTGQKRGTFHQPTILQRAYIAGLLHRTVDLYFIFTVLSSVLWGVVRLLVFEIPFHLLTGFTQPTLQYPCTWGWKFAFSMACARNAAEWVLTISHLRMTSTVITWFIPMRMRLIQGPVDIKPRILLRVHLDELLVPERKTLLPIRTALGLHGASSNPLAPSKEFFESFLPRPPTPTTTSNPGNQQRPVANLPEESGWRDADGSYVLKGEWVEALPIPGDTRPRSSVVLLYCHGGGFVFCSATFHRQLLARMVLEFGPGARAFVVDYRLAPEHPFPAAIHDMYAAYLYLTQPDHRAVRVIERQRYHATALRHVPIDPKNIVLAGDSAGAAIIAGFKLYMRDYVQPSLPSKTEMPLTTVLISGWMDITTSMPSASEYPTHCYTPAMMGLDAVDRRKFDALSKFSFGTAYLCGDTCLLPNERNAMGQDIRWEWYRHLAQHPLVNAVYTANLEDFGDTLLQSGAFDRLRDDTRLMAHRLGQHNTGSDARIRIEVYRDMVHVHQYFEFLPLATHALKNIAAFVEESQKRNKARPPVQDGHVQRSDETRIQETDQQQHPRHELQPHRHTRTGSSSFVIMNSTKHLSSMRAQAGKTTTNPTFDNTEWIFVELDGCQHQSMEGTPIEVLEACWHGTRTN